MERIFHDGAMTFGEIGAAMGVTAEEAESLYNSGLRKLKRHGMKDARDLVALLRCERRHAEPTGPRGTGPQ